MLTKFAAALIATSLLAGSAFAAQPSGNSGSGLSAQTGQTADATKTQTTKTHASKTATTHETAKTAKNRSMRARKHLAGGKSRMARHAHRNVPAKAHQAGVAKNNKHS